MAIGVINEIGDLGLGFDELSEADQKAFNESQKEKNKKDRKDSNDEE